MQLRLVYWVIISSLSTIILQECQLIVGYTYKKLSRNDDNYVYTFRCSLPPDIRLFNCYSTTAHEIYVKITDIRVQIDKNFDDDLRYQWAW